VRSSLKMTVQCSLKMTTSPTATKVCTLHFLKLSCQDVGAHIQCVAPTFTDNEDMEEDDEMQEDPEHAEETTAEEPDSSCFSFPVHEEPVYAVAASPTSNILASGGGDDLAYLWSPEPGTPPRRLSGHTDSVVYVGFSVDGKYLATGGLDGMVKIWDAATAAHIQGALATTHTPVVQSLQGGKHCLADNTGNLQNICMAASSEPGA
jgi:WD40 repeat protein